LYSEILQTYLKDHGKARILRQDGSYVRGANANASRLSTNGNGFCAQTCFLDLVTTVPSPPPSALLSDEFVPVQTSALKNRQE
jgi:hypothetical protein